MKVLFNKSGQNGSTELKSLLGFLDVDIKYSNIKSDIQSATREIKTLIGVEVYNLAYDTYIDETSDEILKELVYHLRYPIAIGAYRMYAPNADLAHTPNGRKMRVEEHEKNAFEWMIDRDNQALERKYYRAVDDLLLFLEESNINEWKESQECKKLQTSLFKTTDAFNEFFPIESRLLLLRMLPGIVQCLNYEIKPRIGNILSSFLSENIPAEHEELYFFVKQASAFYALSWVLPRYSVQMFPEGVLQRYTSDSLSTQAKQVPKLNEVAWAKQCFDEDFRKAISKIEIILRADLQEAKEVDLRDLISGSNFLST